VPRRLARLAPALALAGALAGGCSGDDEPDLPPRTPLPTEDAEPLWNPCDALEPTRVADLFGTTFDRQTGTDLEPRCAFTPAEEGEPVVEVNYQLYGGTLEDVVTQLGDPVGTSEILQPQVPGASGARIIVDSDPDALAVTGLVRNGRLVQVVNTLDLTPYDRDTTVEAVRELMADLAARAEDSGLNTG
jgi:hypothetical protein